MAKEEFDQVEQTPDTPAAAEPAAAAKREDNSSSPYVRLERRRGVHGKGGKFVGSDSPLAGPRRFARRVISSTFASRALKALDLTLEGVTGQTRLWYRLDGVRMNPPKRREGESDEGFRERERKWSHHTTKMWLNPPTKDYGYSCLRDEFSVRIKKNDPTLTEEELVAALRTFYESRLENG